MKSSSAQNPAERRAQPGQVAPWATSLPRARGKRGRLERIREMGVVELAYRGRQEARKLIERLGPSAEYPNPEAFLRQHAPALATPEAALQLVRELAPARFFAGVNDPTAIAALRTRLPEECRDLVAAATDTIITRRIDFYLLIGSR